MSSDEKDLKIGEAYVCDVPPLVFKVDTRRSEELAKKWRPFFEPLVGLKHGSRELQEALVGVIDKIHREWLSPRRRWLEARESWTLKDCYWRDGEE